MPSDQNLKNKAREFLRQKISIPSQGRTISVLAAIDEIVGNARHLSKGDMVNPLPETVTAEGAERHVTSYLGAAYAAFTRIALEGTEYEDLVGPPTHIDMLNIRSLGAAFWNAQQLYSSRGFGDTLPATLSAAYEASGLGLSQSHGRTK